MAIVADFDYLDHNATSTAPFFGEHRPHGCASKPHCRTRTPSAIHVSKSKCANSIVGYGARVHAPSLDKTPLRGTTGPHPSNRPLTDEGGHPPLHHSVVLADALWGENSPSRRSRSPRIWISGFFRRRLPVVKSRPYETITWSIRSGSRSGMSAANIASALVTASCYL